MRKARETQEQKAARLLADGKLIVKRVAFGLGERAPIVAVVEGDNGEYALGYDVETKQWRCSCPARKRCAHMMALQSVTRIPEGT